MNLPQRKSYRLMDYDYSHNGAYFVTICTKNRQEILSNISCRGGALLRPTGEILKTELDNLSKRYEIVINKYVIMPNHIHIIILIQRAEQSPAPTISDIICTFKSITTKTANKFHQTANRQIWQRSFHDHIIRNEEDYLAIWEYIDTNPLKWEEDCFYNQS